MNGTSGSASVLGRVKADPLFVVDMTKLPVNNL
jgi:hypothetical protein